MAEQAAEERVTGEVASVNDKGLKLEGRDGWYDFSRFRTFSALPARGETVTLTVARGKFINAIGDDAGAQTGAAPRAAAGEPMPWDDDTFGGDDTPGRGSAAPRPIRQAAPAQTVKPQAPAAPARSRESVRATTMLAATTFAAGRVDVDFNDVIGMAEVLLAWVTDPKED
jgi:hypothetical protein